MNVSPNELRLPLPNGADDVAVVGRSRQERLPAADDVAERAIAELDRLESLAVSMVDVDRLSLALGEKFEEVRLIHDLTARLELEDDPSEVCEEFLEQLADCVHARSLLIQLDPEEVDRFGGSYHVVGEPISLEELDAIVAAVLTQRPAGNNVNTGSLPMVVNHGDGDVLGRYRVVMLPIQRHDVRLGRLVALRNRNEAEFGTAEANLLRSVLMVLAMHLVSQRQFAEMQSMLEAMVRSLAMALDAKDAYTHGHSSRVADLATQLAQRLGMDVESIEDLQLAGVLHDIGKIGIDDSVLKKPGKLTPEEFEQIKRHPVLGYEILKDIRPFKRILPAVRHHHESWDGCGYPDGLVGNQIPRDAQVLAVADAFDAMVSDRPYRRGMPLSQVREIFRAGRGQQWAADVVDLLLSSDDLLQDFTRKHQSADQ